MPAFIVKNPVRRTRRHPAAAWRAIALSALVAGCAAQWTKPGATAQEFEATKAACTAHADSQFPLMMEPVQVGAGYTTPPQTRCFGTGHDISCTTPGGQIIQPAFVDKDANVGPREQDLQACFHENGWVKGGASR